MNNLEERRIRYMQDGLPIRLGGLAANLARIVSFSRNPANKDAVNSLIEESKYFIEWTAPEAELQTSAELAEIQINLAIWQQNWDANWNDSMKRSEIVQQAKHYSNSILQKSGLLDQK